MTAFVSQSPTALPSTGSKSRELKETVAEMDRAVDTDAIPESTEDTGAKGVASLNDEGTSSVRGEVVDTESINVFDSDQFMDRL